MTSLILESVAPDSVVDVPAKAWILGTLEISVVDRHGTSLIVHLPSYSPHTRIPSGQWAPPHIGYPVDLGYQSPDTPGEILSLIREADEALDVGNGIAQLAYDLGLQSPRFEFRGTFTELKPSPRNPNVTKCYQIHRYGLIAYGREDLFEIADPECRKGFVFLPVPPYGEPTHDGFLGRALATNLNFVVSDESSRRQILQTAVPVDEHVFTANATGLIVALDTAMYGAVNLYANSVMHTFWEDGTQLATAFRSQIASLLWRFIAEVGSPHVTVMGDGLILAIPTDRVLEGMGAVLPAYRNFVGELDVLSESLRQPSVSLGSRIAVHFGTYRFGRVAGTRTFVPTFDGDAVLYAARLEAAVRELTRPPIFAGAANSEKAELIPEVDARHAFAVSDPVKDEMTEHDDLELIVDVDVDVKETGVNGAIFRYGPQGVEAR